VGSDRRDPEGRLTVALRRAATAVAVAALAVACAGGGVRASTAAGPLAIVQTQGAGAILARLDPATLAPREPRADVGEYHGSWSLSPDGTRVAVAVGGADHAGIRIFDTGSIHWIADARTDIAAEAVAWVTPTRIVAALQSGGVVVVDAVRATVVRTLRRWTQVATPARWSRAGASLVVLFAPGIRTGAVQLAAIDAAGQARAVTLSRVRAGRRAVGGGVAAVERPGLAVDSGGTRAFVVPARGPAAQVDLKTLRVSYRVVRPQLPRAGDALASTRQAQWLLGSRLVVFGEDDFRGGQEVAAGVALVDLAASSTRTLLPAGRAAAVSGERILVYGPSGVRVYDRAGREQLRLLEGVAASGALVAGDTVYARTADALLRFDLSSGERLDSAPPLPATTSVELLAP
jgi:hypothetical protein